MSNNYTIENFYDACVRGDVATAEACLASGLNINESSTGHLRFTIACVRGNVATAQACLARGVNINYKSSNGGTPLIAAVTRNHLEIVKILLARDDLDLAVANNNGNTALYMACTNGYADILALICQDRRMTGQIINMKNKKYGNSALMRAVKRGNLSFVEMMSELEGVDWETKNKRGQSLEDMARDKMGDRDSLEDKARLLEHMGVLKFVRKVKSEKDSPIQSRKIKLTKLTQTLENLETKMGAEKIALGDEHKKMVDDLEKEFKEKLSAMRESNARASKSLENQHKKQKEEIEKYIRGVLSLSPTPSPTPAPECPICLESLAPPARLYNCPEGHLLCSECRTKVDICQSCRKPLQGRATAMEQYLRAVYGQE